MNLIDKIKKLFSPLTIEEEILWEWKRLQTLRRCGISGERHAKQHYKLKSLAILNQDAWHNIIFCGVLNERELHEFIWFGGHGGSCRKTRNEHWVNFIAGIRMRQEELPISIQGTLNWYLEVHKW